MPNSISCAVVRDEPPEVFVADDIDTLNWVLASQCPIARTPGSEIPEDLRRNLRSALVDERWGDAVELWMRVHPGEIDVYPSYDFFTPRDVDLGPSAPVHPLFRD